MVTALLKTSFHISHKISDTNCHASSTNHEALTRRLLLLAGCNDFLYTCTVHTLELTHAATTTRNLFYSSDSQTMQLNYQQIY